jgi:hypothetical protein
MVKRRKTSGKTGMLEGREDKSKKHYVIILLKNLRNLMKGINLKPKKK